MIELTPEQTVFLARAQARMNESQSVASREQQAIQDFISHHPFVQGHGAVLREAQARAKAQEEAIEDYCASIGHAGAKLETKDGKLVLTEG